MEEKFRALGHEVRLTIYRALRETKLCVCEITELLEMSQPAVSQHLSKLKNAGLIESERIGQWTFYRPADNDFGNTLAPLIESTTNDISQRIETLIRNDLCDLRNDSGELHRPEDR